MLQAIKDFIKYVNDNAGAFQFVAAVISMLISAVLTLASIFVLSKTLGAIKKQAAAADKQAEVADEQAKAANRQAEVAEATKLLIEAQSRTSVLATRTAIMQTRLLLKQYEQNIAPLLVIRRECVGDPTRVNHSYRYVVENVGAGSAFAVQYYEGDPDFGKKKGGPKRRVVGTGTIGANKSELISIDRGATVEYKGADCRWRWSYVVFDEGRIISQNHWVKDSKGKLVKLF